MARFKNTNPRHRRQSLREVWRWGIWDRLTGRRRVDPPGPPAPEVEPDLELIRSNDDTPRLTWIGHASFLGTVDGKHILIDPVFARRIGTFFPRYGTPGLEPDDLPPIDLLLVSHSHYDHLDAASVKALPRTTPVVTPLRLGRWFRRRGFRHVEELDRWQSVEVAGLRVTLVPSRHWSRRGVADENATLWGGFVVEGRSATVYHAGDSAYFDGFQEIGRRFPNLDAALLPIGGYKPAWFMEQVHMNPEQAGRAFLELGARTLVPMHWGTFQLTDEPLVEPAERLRTWWQENMDGDESRRLRVLAVGETLFLS